MAKFYLTHISNPRTQRPRKDGKPSLEYVVLCFSDNPDYDASFDTYLKYNKPEHLSATDTDSFFKWGVAKTPIGFVPCHKGGSHMRIFSQYYSKGVPTWGTAITAEGFIANCKKAPFFEGERITRAVAPYSIDYSDTIYSTYTLIVFSNENIETVFRQAGHPIDPRQEDNKCENIETVFSRARHPIRVVTKDNRTIEFTEDEKKYIVTINKRIIKKAP